MVLRAQMRVWRNQFGAAPYPVQMRPMRPDILSKKSSADMPEMSRRSATGDCRINQELGPVIMVEILTGDCMDVHIISLGAGVQSSAMALMVSKGDLYKDSITLRKRISGPGQWVPSNVPAFVKNKDGSIGILPRQCTREYKIRPIRRMALSLMRKMGSESITQWIGISLDEVSRMKPSGHGLITNRWPLIELRKTRHDCLRWMKENGFPNPPRSACTFCPYHSDQEWRRLREEDPLDFLNAVAFDKDYRHAKTLTDKTHGQPFLHDSLVPLDEVDFSTDADRGQQEMFNNECEGMCGV